MADLPRVGAKPPRDFQEDLQTEVEQVKQFHEWTESDVAAHNARVKQSTPRGVGNTEMPGPRASEQNTRQIDFTPRPNTDEQKLNKTERAYLWYLRKLNAPNLRIQQVTLKLADDCRLTVDFTYVNANGRMVFVDVKGWQREDALIKIKMAARQFTEFNFVIVKRDGAGWEEIPVSR